MAMSGRVTRRSTPTASQRFHSAPRSRPVLLLIGGIGACFALVIAFVLLGGTPVDDTLPDRISTLESKAAKLVSEEKLEEAIKVNEELIGIAVGERYKVKVLEWRAAIKELKHDIVMIREAKARLSSWEKAASGAAPDQARPLYEDGCRLRDAMPRLWKHDALLAKLAQIPKGPPGWQEENRRINEEHKTDKRGGHWSRALREWKDYLALKLPPADREGAGNCMNTLEQKARDEVRALVNKAAAPEAREGLKLHRLRFEGTAAAAELEKAIAGR